MKRGVRGALIASALVAAASLAIQAAVTAPQSESGEIQLQLGHEFFSEGRYSDALARRTFRFSIVYLAALFAALLVDHYLSPLL